jgi:predicted ATPase/class 3 adenylate cyclase
VEVAIGQSPSVRSSIRVTPELTDAQAEDPGHLEGERKTVTALFADLKGSMELMEDLDPEEARALVDPALKLMIEAVRRYDGYVVQSTGDGIFALFGAPVAHEDHPNRALYAALRMQEELRRYSDKLLTEGRAPLEIRVGVNTGEVVVRSITTGSGNTEYTPIGHTTNLASRMEAVAATGSIAITDHTRQLVEGYFALNSRGPTKIKGVTEPVNVYEVTGLGPLRTRLQRAAALGLTKFVGRERELTAMKEALDLARGGHGQIVAVIGDPGVGKSRMFYEFRAVAQSGCLLLDAPSVSYGKASAYLPVIELLKKYFEIAAGDDERRRREKVAGKIMILDRALEDALPYLYALLEIEEPSEPLGKIDAPVKRRRTLEAIKRILLRESLNQPLILVFEDLHWIDGETQALLNLLADGIANARVLMLVNYRPEYRHEWGNKTYYTQLRLDPLGVQSAAQMLTALLGEDAKLAGLQQLIIDKTEGNPFFIEEMVQALFEQGVLVRNGVVKVARPLTDARIPPTVRDILASRIDRLPANDKGLLQTLAVLGKDFSRALISQVVTHPEIELERMLSDLQLAEFIYEQPTFPEVEYTFKHALTQEVAYNSVLQERRRALHERVGAALEALHRGQLSDHFDDLAHHFRHSDNAAKAVEYLRLAGEQSARRSAPSEAMVYLREALDRIDALPAADERDRAELGVQFALGSALSAVSFAAPEKVRSFERVSELATRIGAGAEVFPALWHLADAYLAQEKVARAGELAQQCLRLAEAANERRMLLGAHCVVGEVACWSGNLPDARSRFMRAIEFYDHAADENLVLYYGIDPFVVSCLMLGFAEAPMGRCDRALKLCQDAQARGAELSHLFSQAFSLAIIAQLHQIRREPARAAVAAGELSTMSQEHGFSEMLGWAQWITGWAMVEQHRGEQGIQIMLEAIKFHESIGGTIATAWRRSVLAEAYAKNSRLDDAQIELRLAMDAADRTGLHLFDAELYRICGEIALRSEPRDQIAAEKCFRDAITVAKRQEARWWELRATTSIARLFRYAGHRGEALAMLAEVYNWFTEGFELPDLKEAKELLEELNR